MNILNCNSPHTVRDDVLKYLDWQMQAFRRAATNSKTVKGSLAARTAANALEAAIQDIGKAGFMDMGPSREVKS